MADYKQTREKRVETRGGMTYIRVKHADGVWRRHNVGLLTPGEAKRVLLARQETEDRKAAGLIDETTERADREAARPIAAVIAEFIDQKTAEGHTTTHIKNTTASLRAWVKHCGVHSLRDADPERLTSWLGSMAKGEKAKSARTRNAHRGAVLGLCRWAHATRRVLNNPIPSGLVKKANEDAGRVRLSRAMTREQFAALLAAVPPHRRAFYLLAGLTGLRCQEIARLRWADIDLRERLMTVPASMTKNRMVAEMPLPEPVAEALERHRRTPEGKNQEGRVFASAPRLLTWKSDLRRARLIGKPPKGDPDGRHAGDEGYIDDRGERLDRKCLRMSYCHWLEDAGVDLRDAQALMRHSDPKLTAKTYRGVRLQKSRQASDRLAVTTLCQIDAVSCGMESKTVQYHKRA